MRVVIALVKNHMRIGLSKRIINYDAVLMINVLKVSITDKRLKTVYGTENLWPTKI